MTGRYLDEAKASSQARFNLLLKELDDTQALVDGRACVYATGSFGRLEAGPTSDLDLFIVVETDKSGQRLLDGIGESKLKYHLIMAVENSAIANFDAGGRYLESHTAGDFTAHLGSNMDDYKNTLTGRLLLLLESRPLIDESLYYKLIDNVVCSYFKDYIGNKSHFMPSFLINDIIRLWRTFCVNYEFSRKKGGDDIKIKNLKLKFSRMLTCYSAIAYILSIHVSNGAVSPPDIKEMVALTPIERLERLQKVNCLQGDDKRIAFSACIDNVLDEYSRFLKLAHQSKSDAIAAYQRDASDWKKSSYRFGQYFAEALTMLGTAPGEVSGMYRMILI